jgi:hypothetical protein
MESKRSHRRHGPVFWIVASLVALIVILPWLILLFVAVAFRWSLAS